MEKIIIIPRDSKLVDFFAMEDGIYKNILFNREIASFQFAESDLVKMDDGKIHFAHTMYTVKKGKKYYTKNKSKKGFTVDEKGKLKIWYGSDIAGNQIFSNALKALKIDWFTNEVTILWPFMTKTLFQKVITGKITNPIDFLSGYLKLSRISASPKLMYAACKCGTLSKTTFLIGAYAAKDVNHYLEYFMDSSVNKTHHLDDLIKQSKILERKIDFKWSSKRMDEEHTNWTKEIMAAEIHSIPDREVKVNNYKKIAEFVPDFFEALDTQKKVFTEGSTMKHCVYTNYWNNINSGTFLAYHIKWKDQEATLGLYSYENNVVRISQIYGVRNSTVSSELRDEVRKIVDWINANVVDKSVEFLKEQDLKFLPF
jgi:hypothetical protein